MTADEVHVFGRGGSGKLPSYVARSHRRCEVKQEVPASSAFVVDDDNDDVVGLYLYNYVVVLLQASSLGMHVVLGRSDVHQSISSQ